MTSSPNRERQVTSFRRAERLYRVAIYGGAVLLGGLYLSLPVTRLGIIVATTASVLYLTLLVAWRIHTTTAKPVSDMRPARLLALILLLSAGVTVGLVLIRIHWLLLLAYVPLALLFLVLADAAVIQRLYPLRRTREEVTQLLESLADGTATEYDWESFVILRIQDPQLDAVRVRFLAQAARDKSQRDRLARECLDELRKGPA